jgi:adenylate cyclase
MVYLYQRQHARAIAEIKQAIALDPNEADNHVLLGGMLLYAGRPQEAIGPVQQSIRLNPYHPVWYFEGLGWFYFLIKRYEEAISALRTAVSRNSYYLYAHVTLAAVYSELGREEEARAEAAEVLRLSPEFSVASFSQRLPFKDPAILERFQAALRKAGLK